MFDTTKLVIHNVFDKITDDLEIHRRTELGLSLYVCPSHKQLFEALLTQKRKISRRVKKKSKSVNAGMSYDDIIKDSTSKFRNDKFDFDVLEFENKKVTREYMISVRGDYNLDSSISGISFKCEYERNEIVFEFSIPKYLYGHSLAEFIPQRGSDNYYKQNQNSSLEYQIANLHERFEDFIDLFLNNLKEDFNLDTPIQKKFVEVRRLDLCYNQYFKTKSDALYYLEMQKKINKKRQTSKTNIKSSYKTSLTYMGSGGAYFKIYHKGTEYLNQKHGDVTKHKEINRINLNKLLDKSEKHKIKFTKKLIRKFEFFENSELLGKFDAEKNIVDNKNVYDKKLHKLYKYWKRNKLFDTVFLKNEMDKVLRYEISLKNKYFSYHFKNKMFRQNDSNHNKYVKLYKDVENVRSNNIDKTFTKLEYDNSSEMKNFLERSMKFMCVETGMMRNSNKKSIGDIDSGLYKPRTFRYHLVNFWRMDMAYLNKRLVSDLGKKFLETIYHYKVVQFDDDVSFLAIAENHNRKVGEKIEDYNSDIGNNYRLMEYNISAKRKRKCPMDMINQRQKMELGLSYINRSGNLTLLMQRMDKGEGFDDICTDLGIDRKRKYEYSKQFRVLGISLKTIKTERVIECEINYIKYYMNTEDINYQNKFYQKLNQINYN